MASPTSQTQPTPLKWNGTHPIFHYACIATSILGPIFVFLPTAPGRHRAYRAFTNFGVSIGTFMAVSQLAYDYTGKSIYQRSNERWAAVWSSLTDNSLPERAQRNRELMREERERRRKLAAAAGGEAQTTTTTTTTTTTKEEEVKGIKKLWMGDEKEGWQQRRLEEEKKALESGKGYGDLIWEQVLDVFGWGEKKEGDKKDGNGAKKE
ncbi:hypothetical protein QBC38DRAFT_475686 [Podospora fimiseda]|uniref:Uncharacterized protein n=1 Tax=Podospora fimiseda TaxID=252190 RepID=A0AAN7BRQ3_9PEZI|nr:hypothetical protein QBC38DRAFT_475686 [Podospora fimiseda]